MDEKELEALKAANPKAYDSYVALKGERDTLKAAEDKAKLEADKVAADKKAADDKGGNDLRDKVRKEKEASEGKATEIKAIERALGFNMGVANFVKDNVDVLPSEFGDLLKAAEKEKFDNAAEKAGTVKASFIQAFFSIQSNVDMLTASQKSSLDDYLKLTKSGKEQKADSIYENIFEPTLEMLKRLKKAEELGKARSGFASSNTVMDGYKARLINASRNNSAEKGKQA